MLKRNLHAILAGSCFLLAFVLLFSFRSYDDNRLFSWQWMFAHTDASATYLLLIAALAGAYVLSRVPVPEAYDGPVLAVLGGIAVLPFWREPEIIVDAARYFTQAKHLSQYGIGTFLQEWGRGIFAWTDLPLVPFCYGILFKIFGESRIVIQAFTSILFSLTVVLTCRIGRQLWDRDIGVAAGLLLLGMPYLLTQVPLMLVDVPTMFLLTLSLTTFLSAVRRGGTLYSVGAAAAVVLFALSKYSSWPMLSLLAVALPVSLSSHGSGDRVRELKRGILVLAAAGGIVGALLLAKSDVLLAQARLLKEYQGPGLGRWGEGIVSTFLFQVHPFITLSALAGVVIAVRKRDRSFLIAGWLLLLVLLFNVQRIRYILPVFPLLALMAAYGLRAFKDEHVRRFIVTGIVATSITVAFFAYLPFARSMSTANLQSAGAFLDGLDAQEIEVIAVQPKQAVMGSVVSVALLDLYTRKAIRFVPLAPELRPSREETERSPLRFSWEFPVPRYYDPLPTSGHGVPVVVVTGSADERLPDTVAIRLRGYQQAAALRSGEGIFQFAPAVFVYERADAR